MKKDEYLSLMQFAPEWSEWGMLDTEFVSQLVSSYRPGNEEASEHDRNGAFHYWLRQNPSKEQLIKLIKLSFLDPDQLMAADVRSHILKAPHCDSELEKFVQECGAA